MDKDLISIAKILNFHGIKGEAKLGFTKGKEAQIENLSIVFVKKDNTFKQLNVKSVRFHKHFAIVKFEEFQTVNDVEEYKGCDIYLSKEEVEKIISEAIKDVNAKSVKDMGQVMKIVSPEIKGRMDMKEVSSIIKEKLN